MRGMDVCYHHGGRSLRGIAHPNHKHGFYCKEQDIFLMVAFGMYQQALRKQQIAATYSQLADTLPMQSPKDYNRFLAAFRSSMQRIPRPKLTAKLAAILINNREQ